MNNIDKMLQIRANLEELERQKKIIEENEKLLDEMRLESLEHKRLLREIRAKIYGGTND